MSRFKNMIRGGMAVAATTLALSLRLPPTVDPQAAQETLRKRP